jgi:tetratricopeptide (TPR) repeat protein
LRERLYTELLPSRRAALHAAAAEQVLASDLDGRDLATAAHHLFESSAASSRVAEVARDAARAALAQLAFEDAALLCERALSKHADDDELTLELELLRGEALMRAGSVPAAHEICVRAALRAKRLHSPVGQARAALVYSIELATGSVDPRMVSILRDALEGLPTDDSPLRARVLARLSAALVPPTTMEEGRAILAQGAEAIAMARRTGDPDTLLFALHYGGSASGYLVSSRERGALLSELYALAEARRNHLVLLGISSWWVATLREDGRVAESEATLAAYTRLLQEFPQPHYRWRLPMQRATLAALAGDFATAERMGNEALAIGEEGGIATARIAWVLHRMAIAHLRCDPASVRPDAERIEALGGPITGAKGFMAWIHAATERPEAARRGLAEIGNELFHFPWCLIGGEAVCLLRDTTLAEQFYPALCDHAPLNPLFWGPFGAAVFGPTQCVAGDLAALLGRHDEARRWYREGLALGESMDAPAFIERGKRGLAALGEPSRASTSSTKAAPREGGIESIAIVRDGEMWSVSSSTGVTMHLKDSKGLQFLSHLVARPRQEVHVTELADLGDVSADAGAVLDPRAKAQYKARLEALRDQLEEATGFGDTARASKLQAEIDALADQLAAAVGLGGRDRKIGSHVERVRINVQRRLRDAIERIEEHDAALGRYLIATVKTGTFCIFSPL